MTPTRQRQREAREMTRSVMGSRHPWLTVAATALIFEVLVVSCLVCAWVAVSLWRVIL